MPEVKLATVNDIPSIITLAKYLGYKEIDKEKHTAQLKHLMSSATDRIAIACIDSVPAGWIHFFVAKRAASPWFLEIGGLVVDPDFRRSGVGSALVQFVKKQAEKDQYKLRVRCSSKRSDAHQFYTHMGFKTSKNQLVFEST